MSDRGICVIIPTYNNSATIVDVVSRSMAQIRNVIVVCDGCTDNTLELLSQMPDKPDIISFDTNKGKGAALKAGFKYAIERGFSYAITLDGDGQHFPEDIPVMIQANRDYPGTLVIGERKGLKDVNRSFGSKFANWFSSFWFTLQTGRRVRDTQSGFRLYPLRRLRGLSLLTSRYEAELELLVLAAWHGTGIASVPVNVYYPPAGERVSHFRPVMDFIRISCLNVVLCILAVVYGYPLCLLRFLAALLRTIYSLVVFIIVTMLLVTPAVMLYMSVGKDVESKKKNLHKLIYKLAVLALYKHKIPCVRYTLSNPYNEDFSKPAVIICNHQSHFDLLPILALTPNLIVLTTDWVWNNPFYRVVIRNADYLPVSSGIDAIMPKLRTLTDKGYSVVVYPEGTRSLDGKIGRFHQGAFEIARQLRIDILPVVLYGSGKVLPKHGRLMRKWPMHLAVDSRIPPEKLETIGTSLKEQASYMRKYYIERYSGIADEIERNV